MPDSVVVEPRAVRAPVHRDEEHQHDHERDGDESPASTGHRHGVKRPETDAAAPAARPGALQQRGVGMLKMHGEDASGTTTCVAGGETACGAGGARGRRLGRDERSPRVARARACAADDDATPTNAPIRRRSRDDDELAGRSSLSCAKKQNFAFPRLRRLRRGSLRPRCVQGLCDNTTLSTKPSPNRSTRRVSSSSSRPALITPPPLQPRHLARLSRVSLPGLHYESSNPAPDCTAYRIFSRMVLVRL